MITGRCIAKHGLLYAVTSWCLVSLYSRSLCLSSSLCLRLHSILACSFLSHLFFHVCLPLLCVCVILSGTLAGQWQAAAMDAPTTERPFRCRELIQVRSHSLFLLPWPLHVLSHTPHCRCIHAVLRVMDQTHRVSWSCPQRLVNLLL